VNDQEATAPSTAPALAAVCGLYCAGCSIFISSHEDPERLALLAARWGVPVEQMHCDGCRAEIRTPYCRECTLFACATERGHTFCVECADYPCKELDGFRADKPHRTEIYENLDCIRATGVEAWFTEMKHRYSCPTCGTLNSAYDLKCRSCGHEPANDYVAAHRDEIVEALSRLQ
jgi:hypothetical protein